MRDQITIKQVANGWVVAPGNGGNAEFVHVFLTPDALAAHVQKWASAPSAAFPDPDGVRSEATSGDPRHAM